MPHFTYINRQHGKSLCYSVNINVRYVNELKRPSRLQRQCSRLIYIAFESDIVWEGPRGGHKGDSVLTALKGMWRRCVHAAEKGKCIE